MKIPFLGNKCNQTTGVNAAVRVRDGRSRFGSLAQEAKHKRSPRAILSEVNGNAGLISGIAASRFRVLFIFLVQRFQLLHSSILTK
jgi:hypothetical protein